MPPVCPLFVDGFGYYQPWLVQFAGGANSFIQAIGCSGRASNTFWVADVFIYLKLILLEVNRVT
tara:strand:+ start:199 stop:390 length:192 start_codon:yes stop_codon:yes gene_type:complete